MSDTNTLPAEDKRKILIVDDSAAMRINMHDVLARHGYTVIEAVDGMNALEVLAREPDVVLVLTDLYMPRMDGLALLRNLRRDQKHIGLPVIIQTTEAQASAVTKARQAGATGWLIKPVGEVAVIRAIDRLLKSRSSSVADKVAVR
jgi:two-component system chemotaxis response regulator CheY